MAVLIWKHDTTPEEAANRIRARLETAGVADKVIWKDNSFSCSIGWGTILNLHGEITDDLIVLTKVSGALGSTVVSQSRQAFQDLFPGGEQPLPDDAKHSVV